MALYYCTSRKIGQFSTAWRSEGSVSSQQLSDFHKKPDPVKQLILLIYSALVKQSEKSQVMGPF